MGVSNVSACMGVTILNSEENGKCGGPGFQISAALSVVDLLIRVSEYSDSGWRNYTGRSATLRLRYESLSEFF